MGSSRRSLLNQATHSSVVSSTGLPGFPRRSAMDQFGLVEPVDCLGQGVVVAVTLAAHRGFDAGLNQAFAVPNVDVLGAAIRVVDQVAVALARIFHVTS